MAAAAVFQLLELLEYILLNMEIKPLLLAQRHWQATILRSRKIQQSLFFVPLDRTPTTLAKLNINYFLVHFKYFISAHEVDAFAFKFNPFNTPPRASCRRMLLTQPPKCCQLYGVKRASIAEYNAEALGTFFERTAVSWRNASLLAWNILDDADAEKADMISSTRL